MKNIEILAISGSLREKSINTDLLKIVGEFLDQKITLSILDRKNLALPIFNPDIPVDISSKETILKSKKIISEAKAILFASPEYNGSMTGAMKNFIDWISIDLGGGLPKNVFANKKVAIVSASPSNFGGIKGMMSLRDVMIHMGAFLCPNMLCLSKITDYSDKQTQLIKEFSVAFGDFIQK